MKIASQIRNGQIKTGHYVNQRKKVEKERNYYDLTKIIMNPTDYCEDEECLRKNGLRLDTIEHILQFCGNKEIEQIRQNGDKELLQIINTKTDKKGRMIIEKSIEKVNLPEIDPEPEIAMNEQKNNYCPKWQIN